MNDDGARALSAALSVARIRAWRTHLLTLHKLLIDDERRRYEQVKGPIGGPHHALQLVSRDPWFAWLRPLAALIIEIDERIAADTPPTSDEVDALGKAVRTLLHSDATDTFGNFYRRALQELPDVVITHGKLLALL